MCCCFVVVVLLLFQPLVEQCLSALHKDMKQDRAVVESVAKVSGEMRRR